METFLKYYHFQFVPPIFLAVPLIFCLLYLVNIDIKNIYSHFLFFIIGYVQENSPHDWV